MPFSAPVLTYRAKGLASNIQSKVLKVHNTLININITAILAPEMTYTPKNIPIVRAKDIASELQNNSLSPYKGLVKFPGQPRGAGFID